MAERIVFLDRGTVPDFVSVRRPAFDHTWAEFAQTRADQVVERGRDATILLLNKVPVSAETLAGLPHLKLIAVAATGINMLDLEALKRRGVGVTNVRQYAGATLPEHTFALMLALRRSIVSYRQSVIDGRWQESGQFCYFDYPINDLCGSTLGIVGDGFLGQAVAEIARGFGMKVLYSDYKGTTGMGPLYTPFERVMAESDVITLHCPLTPQTRHLIGRPEFAIMKKRPLIINTARGGLVDENALLAALETGQIAGAGFDVVTEEPPPSDHVMMRLARRPDVILTPHVAWASREAIQGLADQMMDNVEAFVAGRPRNMC